LRAFAMLTFLLFADIAFAQEPDPATRRAIEAQNPAPVSTLEFEGGVGASEGRAPAAFLRVAYSGKLVTGKGTPFTLGQHLDLASDQTRGAGDRHAISLLYEQGSGELGGGLFEALGVQPLRLRGLESLRLRGTAFVTGDEDAKQVRMAVGLESPPFRVPGFRGTSWSNWIVLGVSAVHDEATDDDAGDNELGLVTASLFVGRSFFFRQGADADALARGLAESILAEAPTSAAARRLVEAMRAEIPANRWTVVQTLVRDATAEALSEESWEDTVRELCRGAAEAMAEEPAFSIYVEGSGWQPFAGPEGSNEPRGLVTATGDYWPEPGRNDFFVRIRYELGHEHGRPGERLDRVLASFGGRF